MFRGLLPRFVRPASCQLGCPSYRAFSLYHSLLNESSSAAPTFGSVLNNPDAGKPSTKGTSTAVKKVTKMKTLKHVLHCRFSKNNTFMTLSKVEVDLNHEHNNPEETFNQRVLYYLTLPQKIVMSQSTGYLGFRKAQRGEYEASFQLTSNIFKMMSERHLLKDSGNLEIVVKEFGKGRKAFFDALKGKEGSEIREYVSKLSDLTAVKYGGTRSPAKRRV